ncbi:restriction system protein [Paenibacillus mucilaginosus]
MEFPGAEVLNEGILRPLVFMGLAVGVYIVGAALLCYTFLRWLPDFLVRLMLLAGALYVGFVCFQQYEGIKTMLIHWKAINYILGACLFVLTAVFIMITDSAKKTRTRKASAKAPSPQNARPKSGTRRTSTTCRADEVLLASPFSDLSGAEFERLLALYFKDQGYQVQEVGVGGKDGGVDLVITDKLGEKTAVQAKCYADGNKVGVPVVRELVGAKRNHDCILSLLITTSDLTATAKKEADQFKVDYWHGALLEQKLRAWGQWTPGKRQAEMKSAKAR